MKLYLAPMEGITGFVYRNALNEFTGGRIDKFYTPFIEPRPKKGMYRSERRDLDLANNTGLNLVPQILTKNAEAFSALAEDIYETYGYQEINLNCGCPSKTVVARNKGAGMLEDVEDLEAFLERIFDARKGYDISIKTRLGMYDLEEMYQVLEVYNKFPIKELSVHVRLQNEYYKHPAHMDLFKEITTLTDLTLSYNGDIYKASDVAKLKESMENSDYEIESVMLGRGLIGNPFLVEDIYALEEGKYQDYDLYDADRMKRLKPLLDDIFKGYAEIQDANTAVYRMKEIWAFLIDKCTLDKKALKAIRTSENGIEYEHALRYIF